MSASKDTPPDVQQLNADKQSVEAGSAIFEAMELDGAEERIKSLVLFLESSAPQFPWTLNWGILPLSEGGVHGEIEGRARAFFLAEEG